MRKKVLTNAGGFDMIINAADEKEATKRLTNE